MAQSRKKNVVPGKAVGTPTKSAALSAAGVKTGEQFAAVMSALMSEVIDGQIAPSVANAACNAGGKLLKVVEMQYKYGSRQPDEEKRPSLLLAP